MTDRPSWTDIFLDMADTVARRSTCPRLQVGCVVVTADHRRVLAIGFNGNWAGGPNTCDDPTAVGACQCVHAEINALLKCDNTVDDRIVYTTHSPCRGCAKAIINSGAGTVVFRRTYRTTDGEDLLQQAGVRCIYAPEAA